ncbi:hypothetical protein [Paenibacillus wenxiniae]|uniref:Septation ring formation regulator EzrA n=1 Tax=Paenibacillus wenxiniae TaxID=1636843 RepID=A0ABW4RGB4_9BACL
MPWIIGIILFFAILNWIFEFISSIGTAGWISIGCLLLLWIISMIWRVERKHRKWLSDIEDAILSRQDQISGLIVRIVRLLDEIKPFDEMTRGESGKQIKEIDRQLTRMLVELNRFLEDELKQEKNWRFHQSELAELLKIADQQFEEYSEQFNDQHKKFEHIAETERQVLDNLRIAEQTIVEAEQTFISLQHELGSSLPMMQSDFETAREWLAQAREIRYQDPLRAEELADYASKKSKQLLQDVYDLNTFNEFATQLPERLERTAQQIKQDMEQYGLHLANHRPTDELHHLRSLLPQLHQYVLEGNSMKARHLWHDLNQRLHTLAELPARQLELKKQYERQITSIRKQMDRIKQDYHRLYSTWTACTERYLTIYGKDMAETYVDIESVLSDQIDGLDQARRLSLAENDQEAIQQLKGITRVLETCEHVLLETERNIQMLPRLEQQQQLEQLNARYEVAHALNFSKLKFITRTTLQNNHQRFNYEIKQYIEQGLYDKAQQQLSEFGRDVKQLEQL